MSNKDHEFKHPDPLDAVGGTVAGSSEFIPESTMIPESGLILHDESGHGNGPEVLEDGDGHGDIPESVSTDSADAGAKKSNGGSGLKKNVPFIVLGVAALGIAGAFGVKMMGGDPPPEPVAVIQPLKPAPKQAPVEVPMPAAVAPIPLATDPVANNASNASNASGAAPVEDPYSTKGMGLPKEMPGVIKTMPVTNAMSGFTGTPVSPAGMAPNKSVGQAMPAQCAPVTVEVPKCNAGAAPIHAAKSVRKSHTTGMKFAKKKTIPLPSTEGFEVQMGANGLAWIILPGNEKRVVTVGDRIEGLGIVKEINTEKHLIRVGRVILR